MKNLKVMLWFDVEDFITPEADDALLALINMMDSLGQLIFFLLTPLSHIGASLFFAKPRFGKWATAAIWLLYVALMMLLPAAEVSVRNVWRNCSCFRTGRYSVPVAAGSWTGRWRSARNVWLNPSGRGIMPWRYSRTAASAKN